MSAKIEQLKKHMQKGHLELARLDQNNQPVKMELSQLQQQTSQLNHQQKIYQLVSGLTWEEKFEWVNIRRLKGNHAFKNDTPQKALEIYLESLIGLDLKTPDQDKLAQVKLDLQFPILMNMAACFYKLKLHQKGIEICDQVLNDPFGKNNLQALYKKAYFLYELSSFDKAKYLVYHKAREILLQLSAKLDNGNSQGKKVSRNDLKELLSKIIAKTKQEKNMYKRIFDQGQDEQYTECQQGGQDSNTAVLEYHENFLKRTIVWVKQAFESCYRAKSKDYPSKDEDQRKGLLSKRK